MDYRIILNIDNWNTSIYYHDCLKDFWGKKDAPTQKKKLSCEKSR